MTKAISDYWSTLRRNSLLSIVFWINIISSNTVIPSIVEVPTDVIQFIILVCINSVCIVLLSSKVSVTKTKVSLLFKLLLAVLIFEVIKSPFIDGALINRGAYSILIFLMMGSFMLFLNLSIKKRGNEVVQAFLFTYVIFSLCVLLTTIIAYLLVHFDFVSLGKPFDSYLFESNMRMGSVYYFPANLSILQTPEIRIPFIQKYGLFCGVFHEPHVANYYIAPGIFFSFYFIERKLHRTIIILLYMIFVLVSFSTTNVLVLLLLLLLYIIKEGSTVKILFSFLILFVFYWYFSDSILMDQITEEVGLKFKATDSGSLEYSTNRLAFLLHPSSFLGSTLYTTAISSETDIGVIPFILNILFVGVLFYKGLLFYFKVNPLSKSLFIALGCVYFLFHSMKTNALNYQYTYLVFIVWLIVTVAQSSKQVKPHEDY